MSGIISNVLANTWSQMLVLALTFIAAWLLKGPVFRGVRTGVLHISRLSRLSKENTSLRQQLEAEKEKNDEWEGIISDIERRYIAIREELDRTKQDLSRLREMQEAKSRHMDELEIDIKLLLHWGRGLVGQLMSYGVVPTEQEPELLTIEKPPIKKE